MIRKYLVIADWLAIIFLSILCYFFYFQRLGDFTLRMWDEARNGVNALEMLQNNNLLVTYFRGNPDDWNLKPPLLIWIMVGLFKVFGVSELVLRLPSAIAVSGVTLGLYLFSVITLKNRWGGLLGSLILLSSYGFADTHIGRTADYDALLTLWVFLASVTIFIYTQSWKRRYFFLSVTFWILAVLTKGIAGLLMIPGLLIFLIATRNLLKVIKRREFYQGVILFIAAVGIYYLGRELANPGYLINVWHEEFFNRTRDNNETATNMFRYYWQWAKEMRFQHWTIFVPFSFISYFLIKAAVIKKWVLYTFSLTVSYYFIISLTQTKNLWYDAQLYPFVSLLVAILIYAIIRKIPFPLYAIPTLILGFYLQRYLRTNLAYIQRPDTEKNNPCYKYGYLFRHNTLDKVGVVGVDEDAGHCMPFVFYMEKEGILIKQIAQIIPGDKALTCDETTANSLTRDFKTNQIFDNNDGCRIYEIIN